MVHCMRPDRVSLDVDGAEWFFTIALGVAGGLVANGLWLAMRRGPQRQRGQGVTLAVSGLVLMAASIVSTVDQLPFTVLAFKLKPYISSTFIVTALDLAFVLGLGISLLVIWGSLRILRGRFRQPWVATGSQLAVSLVAVIALLAITNEADRQPRHPAGTETGEQVSATRIVDGLEMPTGLAIGPDGELVFVELMKGALTIAGPAPAGGGPRPTTKIDLGLAEGALTFHVALHPQWPAEPYAYVTAQQQADGRSYLQVLRVKTSGPPEVTPVITRLPTAQPGESNHYGTAVAFCGDSFFLTTGDTDPYLVATDIAVQSLAQLPTKGEGKVLRYRLSGFDLVPDGYTASEPPVFAIGFRNPFAATCDIATGQLLVAENGRNTNDQVRLVTPGSNHEWPFTDTRDMISKPVFDTGHMTIAPAGIATRRGASGSEIILSAFKSTGVYLLHQGADSRVDQKPRLLHEFPHGPLAVAVDQRGCIYVADAISISRLDEEGCRQEPTNR